MNSYRRAFVFLAAAVCASASGAGIAAEPAKPAQLDAQRHKVVFQVSEADPAKWNLTLNNVKNVQQDLGAANVEIEVVAYGPGIGMIKLESPAGTRVSEAIAAGVVALMQRQKEGYAYIRP